MSKFNQKGGFIQIIIMIVIVVCLLYYFNVNIGQAFDWVVNAFHTVFNF